MIPILYESGTERFVTNGIGRLSDSQSCTVVEERNGEYELSLSYPIDGVRSEALTEGRIILATPSEGTRPQPFRIYRVSKSLGSTIDVDGEHISYLLSKIPVMPFTANSCSSAMAKLKTNSAFEHSFTFWTDISKSGKIEKKIPASIRSILGGDDDANILSIYGPGDLEFDRFEVKLHADRGHNNGVSIRYGKNLTDLKDELDVGSIYTGIVPYYKKAKNDPNTGVERVVLVTLPEKVIWADTELAQDHKYAIPVELNSMFEDLEEGTVPTVAQLRTAANQYLSENVGWNVSQNITVSFIALWQTEEYKNIAPLERVKLCDVVNVVYPKLNVNVNMRVIKTTYNVLLDRYESIELGDAKANINSSIKTASNTSGIASSIADLNDRISDISSGGGGSTGKLDVAFNQGAMIFSNGT